MLCCAVFVFDTFGAAAASYVVLTLTHNVSFGCLHFSACGEQVVVRSVFRFFVEGHPARVSGLLVNMGVKLCRPALNQLPGMYGWLWMLVQLAT